MKNKKYPVDFKLKAVEYHQQNNLTYAEAAKSLGIGESTLYKWKIQKGAGLFSGKKLDRYDSRDEEIRRLASELKRSQMEVEILKKATAFFAKELK
jgi:transposase